jgi:hypothetical protein
MHRNGGRLASGMPVGIPPESRSASERNAGRHGPDSAIRMSGKKGEVTSGSVASKAGKLLSNPKTPAIVKSVAASALTQRPGKKK